MLDQHLAAAQLQGQQFERVDQGKECGLCSYVQRNMLFISLLRCGFLWPGVWCLRCLLGALRPACVARMRCVHSTATVSAAVVQVKQKDVTGTVGNPVCLRRCYTACGDWFGGGLLGFASFY
jgi:hypothetical protein